MTRTESAFLRAVGHHVAKLNPAFKALSQKEVAEALRMYEAWATPKQAADKIAAPLRERPHNPVSVDTAARLLVAA